MSEVSTPVQRVRWGLIALVTVLGLLLTAAPFMLAWRVGREFGDWRSLASATLTNVGTTLLLVAAIWFLERKFTSRLVTVVQATTREVVAEETSDIAAHQRDLSLRLDELQARLDERSAEAVRAHDAVIQRLSDEVSFASVRAALEQVGALGALWFGQVTVPVGDGSPDKPRFLFRMSTISTTQRLDKLEPGDPSIREVVQVEYELDDGRDGSAVSVVWESDASPVDVVEDLRRKMTAAGFANKARQVDASLFTNLHAALQEAVAARRGDPEAWLNGPLDEWINDEWAITQYGLEHRGPHGMRSEEFPVHWNGHSNYEATTWRQPTAPEGVDADLWSFLIRRARRHHRPGVPFPR